VKSQKIKSITKTRYSGYVHNIAVEKDETYFANNILVHNCRSVLVPILIGEKDNPDSYFYEYDSNWNYNIKPAKGFGG
jgi:hypothetical protein